MTHVIWSWLMTAWKFFAPLRALFTSERIIAITTTIYALVSIKILREMRAQTQATKVAAEAAKKSADTAENSAVFAQKAVKSSERADVLLDSAVITQSLPSAIFDRWLVLTFKNFGRTRAKNVSFDFRMVVPGLTVSDSPTSPLPPVVLGAGQEKIITFKTFRQLLPEKTFNKVVHEEVTDPVDCIFLRFETSLVYQDVFDDTHLTRYVIIFNRSDLAFEIEECNAG